MQNSQPLEQRIKNFALTLGVAHLGITTPEPPKHYNQYVQWTEKGYAGSMWYLTEKERKQKRGNLEKVFPGVKSVLIAAFSYKPQHDSHATNAKFARYGWGKDYHDFVKQKLQLLVGWMEKEISPAIRSHIYVDTGPILEKSLAERGGVGWIGKNTCLINQQAGSYLYLGEILLDMELQPDKSASNHCGTCTKCLDACPTNAFVGPYQMDATRCISYHTIESKDLSMPKSISENLNGYVAGCDICQEVCPWNNKAPASTLEEIRSGENISLTLQDILDLTQEKYDQLFFSSSFRRIPLEKLKANARFNLEVKK